MLDVLPADEATAILAFRKDMWNVSQDPDNHDIYAPDDFSPELISVLDRFILDNIYKNTGKAERRIGGGCHIRK
jgi:hypothetical protein